MESRLKCFRHRRRSTLDHPDMAEVVVLRCWLLVLGRSKQLANAETGVSKVSFAHLDEGDYLRGDDPRDQDVCYYGKESIESREAYQRCDTLYLTILWRKSMNVYFGSTTRGTLDGSGYSVVAWTQSMPLEWKGECDSQPQRRCNAAKYVEGKRN